MPYSYCLFVVPFYVLYCRITMKLIIFGGTGRTGQFLLQQALDVGHEVTAIARDPAKIITKHDKLTVKQVNIFDQEELLPLFKETDAVISTLGFAYKPKPVSGYSRFAEASSKALKNVDCKRLIVMHSWFTKEGIYIFYFQNNYTSTCEP